MQEIRAEEAPISQLEYRKTRKPPKASIEVITKIELKLDMALKSE